MKAFVTGSTGLLGSNLVKPLLAQGWQVKALARSKEKAQKLLGNTDAEIVVGDMEDIDGFASSLAGCDVLFHTAAYFREYYVPGDHWRTLQKINVDGTIKLLSEAARHKVKKAIYVSSSGTIGKTHNNSASDESTPPDNFTLQNLYFKSKLLSEEAVAEWQKTHQMPVVIILPTAMLGPQDAAPTAIGQAIVDILMRKQPAIPPGGFEFVDARDVAQAMLNAVEHGRAGERYIISQGYHSMGDMVETIEKVSGVPAPRLHLPYPLAIAVAWFSEMVGNMTNKPPLVTVEAIRTMNKLNTLSAAKSIRELGVKYRPFAESLRDQVEWYRANQYVRD